jgi:sarcosine oxidase subunit beta
MLVISFKKKKGKRSPNISLDLFPEQRFRDCSECDGILKMNDSYDVVIIGAGIMGSSSAYQLALSGRKVALIDKGTIGGGPSGESSAIIRQHYSNVLTARMALFSLRVFQNFRDQIGGECGFTETGVLMLVDDKDHAGLEANLDLQKSVGIKTNLINAHDIRELIPGVNVPDTLAAAYEPEGGYADPYQTVTAYARAAENLGVDLFQEEEVTDVFFEGDQVAGVSTTQRKLMAPRVLNTAGAWAAHVARMVDVGLPINSCRVQVAFFRRPPGFEAAHPVVGDFVHASYFRSETGSLTLAGLIDPAEADAIVDPDRFNRKNDLDFVLDIGERLIRRYPVIERSESTGGYASLYAITPDWHPIVDEVPAQSGFFICSGFSGHGFKLGPAVGQMVADLINGIGDPEFNPHPFRLSRFDENEQVKGQYEYSIIG